MSVTSGGTAPNGFSRSGSTSGSSTGSRGNGDHLGGRELAAVAVAVPTARSSGQVGGADHHAAARPYCFVGSCAAGAARARAIWCSAPRSTVCVGLRVLRSKRCSRVAVMVRQQLLGDDPLLDHRGRAPLAGHQHVVVDEPPEVVGEVLVAAVDLPLALDLEGVVAQRDAAGAESCAVDERR